MRLGAETLRSPPGTRPGSPECARPRPGGCGEQGNDTATLEASPLPRAARPPNWILGTWAPRVGTGAQRGGGGEATRGAEKRPGLRAKGQPDEALVSPHSGKSLRPSHSQPSLPPHESQGRLLLLSNLEK